jgi:Tfp pilus assembly protein PilV
MKNNNLESGQSLLEIVVAVGIIALVLVGVSDLITRSLGLTSFQAKKNIAVNIAENQLTYCRQKRDLNPTDFFASPHDSCGSCVDFDSDEYECQIAYDSTGITNGVNMTVSVTWQDGEKTITTQLSQLLFMPLK